MNNPATNTLLLDALGDLGIMGRLREGRLRCSQCNRGHGRTLVDSTYRSSADRYGTIVARK